MDRTLVQSVLATVVVMLVPYVLYRVARWARARPKGAYVLGAVLTPLGGLGNVADPDFRIVNEAKQMKRREEDDAGDPPDEARSEHTPIEPDESAPSDKEQ